MLIVCLGMVYADKVEEKTFISGPAPGFGYPYAYPYGYGYGYGYPYYPYYYGRWNRIEMQ